jgi:hypothetical protein
MRDLAKRYAAASLLGLLIVCETYAQPKWRVYSPSNKSFSVELPWEPINRRRNLTSYMPNSVSPFKGSTVDDWYDLSMYIDESTTRFFIHVYDVAFKRSQEEFDREVRQIMLVDTCKRCLFLKDESVVVNGLSGREYVYQQDKVTGRVLFINGGRRIYTIHFNTENKKGISRGPVDRVFSTFQPTAK